MFAAVVFQVSGQNPVDLVKSAAIFHIILQQQTLITIYIQFLISLEISALVSVFYSTKSQYTSHSSVAHTTHIQW
jgi:hypothetical protein